MTASSPSKTHLFIVSLPLIGILLFLLFYVLAALNYPGGSYLDPAHPGFSFTENYLCDLLDDVAMNGELNTAKEYARISLGIMCFSLMLLWAYLPRLFDVKRRIHVLISLFGILSMLITLFLGLGGHDVIVRIAGALGAIALILTFRQLYKAHHYKLLALGILSIVLVAANYYLYETGEYLELLPILQKFTFISCLSWFALLNIMLLTRLKRSRQ